MKLTFHSVDNNNDKVLYTTEYTSTKENTYTFTDLSVKNTTITLEIKDKDNVLFLRDGDIKMSLLLSLNDKTLGNYKNELGLEFEFIVTTKKIAKERNKLMLEYDMLIEDITSTHKINILFH